MSVEISGELQPFVQSLIESGQYGSENDVVNAALKAMLEEKLEIETIILEGIAQYERGECYEIEGDEALHKLFEDIKARGRKRLESRRMVS